MMTIIVEMSAAFGLTVTEKKTGTLLVLMLETLRKPREPLPSSPPTLVVEEAGQKYAQLSEFV